MRSNRRFDGKSHYRYTEGREFLTHSLKSFIVVLGGTLLYGSLIINPLLEIVANKAQFEKPVFFLFTNDDVANSQERNNHNKEKNNRKHISPHGGVNSAFANFMFNSNRCSLLTSCSIVIGVFC